ncbi:unnamed protein product [Moneuplotes crassus]|uniref:Uncharacterized protein n=1 Tax=Euplotes crassus TaxID=5936 RepID=A0AAD1XIZ5_EUPCR|nr:unnamed protein product [Moneuplotes crassus]
MTLSLAAASTTLAENGSYKFTIKFSMNSSNNSNSDVRFGLTVGSTSTPLTNLYYATGACVNVGTSNYQLSTTNATLKGFGVEWRCGASCSSLSTVYTTVVYYAGMTWGQDTSHVASVATASTISTPAGSNTHSDSDKSVYYTLSGLTPSQLASTVYLPNQTETWYVRCFGDFNHATSKGLGGAVANLATTIGNGKNLTIKGSGYQVAAILAVSGSLIASLA